MARRFKITNPETGESRIVEANEAPSQEEAWAKLQASEPKRDQTLGEAFMAGLMGSEQNQMARAAMLAAAPVALGSAVGGMGGVAGGIGRWLMTPAGAGIAAGTQALVRTHDPREAALEGLVVAGGGKALSGLGGAMARAAARTPAALPAAGEAVAAAPAAMEGGVAQLLKMPPRAVPGLIDGIKPGTARVVGGELFEWGPQGGWLLKGRVAPAGGAISGRAAAAPVEVAPAAAAPVAKAAAEVVLPAIDDAVATARAWLRAFNATTGAERAAMLKEIGGPESLKKVKEIATQNLGGAMTGPAVKGKGGVPGASLVQTLRGYGEK